MTGANLSCFRCGSEFEPVSSDGSDRLYQCEDCGMSLTEKGTRELSKLDGPMADLADALLAKAGDAE